MITPAEIKSLFHLSHAEKKELDAFFESTNSKVNRLCCLFFSSSVLKATQKNLEARAVRVIEERFGPDSGGKASSLSLYLINSLISDERQKLLSDHDEISLNEMVDRAPFGDGTDLPLPPRQVLITLLKKEFERLNKVVSGYCGPKEQVSERLLAMSNFVENEKELKGKSEEEIYQVVKELRTGIKQILTMAELIFE